MASRYDIVGGRRRVQAALLVGGRAYDIPLWL